MELFDKKMFTRAILFLTFITVFVSCKKSETDGLEPSFSTVKVLDDTLANAESPVSMAAGYGRIFMTYGISGIANYTSYGPIWTNLKPVLACTDNNGNFLWKAKIPEAMESSTIVPLSDGGCVLATFRYFGSNPGYTNNNLYLFRFDGKGNMTQTDSVAFVPTISDGIYMQNIGNLIKANGNILFYGDTWNGNSGFQGWAFEYSLGSGLKWIKKIIYLAPGAATTDVSISGCVETPDNGLLFSGSIQNNDSAFNITVYPFLLKATASGDTLWTRQYSQVSGIWSRNLVAGNDGSYLFCFNSYDIYDDTKPTAVNIYRVNQQGDSLNAYFINNEYYNSTDKIIRTDDGGFFALINQTRWNAIYTYQSYLVRNNTRKVYFDPEFNWLSDSHFQGMTADLISQVCRTSDGSMACFGLFQPVGKTYYRPQLYIIR